MMVATHESKTYQSEMLSDYTGGIFRVSSVELEDGSESQLHAETYVIDELDEFTGEQQARILRGLSQRGTIDRGSFAEFAE